MLRTKLEVDKHVENCLKKINSQAERNQRYFSFARLYFNIGEYEQARRYLSSYLSAKPKSAEGYHLLGKTLEKLGKKDAALEAYRTSLQLDPKQNNLVIKVCELLSSDDVNLDQSGARYFCEMAQSFDPQNPAVFSLKERLIMTDNKDPSEVSTLLLKELEDRPTDINLRVRLLKHFLQHNMIQEAYKHVSDIENKNLTIFQNNIRWYEVVAEILLRYQRDSSLNTSLTWEYWIMSVSVLDRLVALSLDERSDNVKICSEYVSTVFNFDQTLMKASENIDTCPDRQLAQEFLTHYRGQLCFHLATLLFKQAKKDLIKFKDACNVSLPILFAAYHTKPVDLQTLWVAHTTESRRNRLQRWNKEASFRCSQAGHILNAWAKDRKSTILEKASQYSTGMWREYLFKKVFITRDHQLKINTSYFVTCPQLTDITIRLPDTKELLSYDEVAQLLYPDSLHHYIWVALNYKLVDFPLTAFEGLQYSVKNLTNCAAESLSILDIQAFIYCSTLCAQSQLAELKNLIYYNPEKPSVLPAAITEQLGTNNQTKFIAAAHKMYKKDYSADFGELRLLLIKGLEVVRCIGHHGLDVKLLVLLANIFAERSKKLSSQSEIEYNDARAELYWKTALPLLEKLKNNQAIVYSNNRWFEYKTKEMSMNEINTHIEKGSLFTGVMLMKKKEHDKALKIFESLRDPYASFYQAQIYKQMADQITSHNKENVTSEMRSQNIIILSRARDCLYLTLDRLREPSVDRNHPLNSKLGTEIENIERLLSRIDPDCINRNECDGMSDENVSSADSVGDHYVTGVSLHQSYLSNTFAQRNDSHNIHSTPLRTDVSRREARPSPERLDAQLRQLAAAKDASINHILEQNKVMVDSHRSLVEELRSFKEAVYNLTSTVDDLKMMKHSFQELKEIKKSVDELKASVDELQNFKNVTDVVYEMKKEISELKKDVSKQPNQLSDEDLCILDGEYGGEYNMASHMTPTYNQNLYSNYQGRLPAPNPLPYGALYPGMYSPMAAYPYGGLGLPQPGPLAFSPDQHLAAELRAIQLGQVQPPVSYAHAQPALGQPLMQSVIPTSTLALGVPITQPLLSQVTSPSSLYSKIPSSTVAASSLFQTVTTTALSTAPSTSSSIFSKAPPVNVVITSSDPLPSSLASVPQKPLSVTIPPQHLKGNIQKSQPHNYQIPLPTTSLTTTSTPSVLSKPAPLVTTQSILSNVAPPVYSAVTDKSPAKNVSLGLQIEKTLDKAFNSSKPVADMSKSDTGNLNLSNVSSASLEEHDPCPDFKPIVPLPDEVPLHTGEEDETVLFSERAKLFRFDSKEWKERGVGVLKILLNEKNQRVRILMRRDQVHKICANHFLTTDMKLTPMPKSDKEFIWAAQDYADEQLVTEKFCVRFKTLEEAKRFCESFEKGQKIVRGAENTKNKSVADVSPVISKIADIKFGNENKPDSTTKMGGTSLGGFVFNSTPTFKPKLDDPTVVKSAVVQEPVKSSPFSGFTFTKQQQPATNLFANLQSDFKPFRIDASTPKADSKVTTTSKVETKSSSPNKSVDDDTHTDDFVPTAEFKPVVPLPELVEIKTGEENAEILFECRAKLLRFDTSGETKEWKERGIGIMKVLKENIVRLVMRREQVHKVCCNHQVFKNMAFQKMTSNPKAVTWCAQDFSEGVVKAETFALRFKTSEEADEFLKTISEAQAMMDENSNVLGKKSENIDDEGGPPSSKKDLNASAGKQDLNVSGGKHTGFGDKFKMAKGNWECKTCYIANDSKSNYCIACDSPKNNTIPPKSSTSESSGTTFSFGVPISSSQVFSPVKDSSQEVPKGTFVFGSARTVPTTTEDKSKPAESKSTAKLTGWGDAFQPQAGSWECCVCLVRNKPDVLYCASCECPKDDTVPAKETNKGISLDTGGQKFSFGIPAASSVPKTTFTFGQPATDTTAQFSFGAKTAASAATTNLFSNTTSSFTFVKPETTAEKNDSGASGEKFVFGSPQKHDFGFTPRSPRRVSSGQGDEDSDGSYEEEADNIYFKPVIPLPEKVDVVTGEEGEEVLYCHRAKLFRFVSGEWKERGLGDIKVLKNKENGKLRVLMRREQVLKICLNHVLTSDIDYIAKDNKTWLFSAPDFSEGEINHQQFCLRFKTPEVAQEFKKAVVDALANASGAKVEEKVTEEDDSDVEFVSETKVTSEEEKEAEKLGLPSKFMAYRQLPDCSCDQCKKDDEYLGEELDKSSKQIADANKPSTPAEQVNKSGSATSFTSVFGTPFSTCSSVGSVFGTPKEQSVSSSVSTSSVASANAASDSPKLKELLMKPPLLNTPQFGTGTSQITSSFGTTQKTVTDTPTTSSNITVSSSLFGTKPTGLFGTPQSQSSKTESPSTFSFAAPKLNVFSPATTSSGGIISASSTAPPTAASGGLFSTPTTASGVFGSPAGGLFKSTTTTNIFGSTTSAGSIFGSSSGITGSIFAATTTSASTTATGSIFGSSATPFNSSGSIFASGKPSGGGIFGSATTPASGLFTSTSVATTTTTPQSTVSSSIFGKPGTIFTSQADTKPASIFGQSSGSLFSSTPSGNLFGTSSSIFGQSKTSLFGGFDASKATPTFGSVVQDKMSIFGTNTQTSQEEKPVFGSSAVNAAQDKPLSFEALAQKRDDSLPTFGSVAKETQEKPEKPKQGDEVVLKCDSDLSFASLAAKTSEDAPPAFNKKSDDATPFAFLGAGQPVFASIKKKESKKNANVSADGEEAEGNVTGTAEEEYDPHYEPIVPLPDAIVVSTGEEDEVIEFNERAKLYRYDDNSKEWKERGVGQMKILHHPVNRTYRFLLRREQVHKVVLNQLIRPDLELQPMTTSDKAWIWGGHNYTDDGAALEKLAIRFKNCELAKQFYDTVQNVIAAVKDIQANKSLPSVLQNYSLEDVSAEESGVQIQEITNESEEYGEDEDDDEDDRSVMFMKRCILSEEVENGEWIRIAEGDIQIYYDSEVYAAKIGMNDDDGMAISNTLIGLNTIMEMDKKDCIWRAVEWATDQYRWRNLKATFASEDDAAEFFYNYEEGLSYAKQCEIIDALPMNSPEGSED